MRRQSDGTDGLARTSSSRSDVQAEQRLLRSFVAVVEEGSFTAAARRLHLTQQAVSLHVSRLEFAVGGALLVRTTRSLCLTDTGEALFDEARDALRGLDAVVARARRRTAMAPARYTMGFSPSLSQAAIPAMMARVPADSALSAHQKWFDEMIAGLADETLDVGVAVAPTTHSDLESIVVGTTRLAMTVRANEVAPGQSALQLAALIDYAVTMPDRASNPGLHDILAAAWQSLGRDLDVVTVPRLLGPSILEISRHDICSPWPMVMPSDYVPKGLTALPVEPRIDLDIVVMARDCRSIACRFVVDTARSALQTLRDRGARGVTVG